MTAKLHRVGQGQHRVIVVDDVLPDLPGTLALAGALAPYPPSGNYYPGVRRVIAAGEPANAYVAALMQAAAPYIAGAFDRDRFRVEEASFSMVTARPEALAPPQRAPHFDSTDPDHLAALHYLSVPGGGGTAFFRHRATGIEQLSDANVDRFVNAARLEGFTRPPAYAGEIDPHFELLLSVEARPNRLLIYPGSLLHSGLIPPEVPLSADPAVGRLTGNFFLQLESAP